MPKTPQAGQKSGYFVSDNMADPVTSDVEPGQRQRRSKNFSAVSEGRATGIFEEWSQVKQVTKKVTNCYKGYVTLDEAIDHMVHWYRGAMSEMTLLCLTGRGMDIIWIPT